MDNNTIEKMKALASDQDFIQKMNASGSVQEMLSVLNAYGVEAQEDELMQYLSGVDAANGELDESMLENVAGGGAVWNWVKKCLNNWFEKQCDKNTKDINKVTKTIFKK